MTKKRQKREAEAPREPRRHRRLRQEEARKQRFVLIGVGLAVGLVIVILLAGAVNEFVLKPRRPIASINGETISTAAFQRRLRFEQNALAENIRSYIQFSQQLGGDPNNNPFLSFIQQMVGDLSQPDRFSLTVLNTMTEEVLVRQLAQEYGVEVSEEEVQLEIERQLGYDRDAPPPPTPEPSATVTDTLPAPTPMTAEAFLDQYNEIISGLKERDSLTESEYRQLYRDRLLREKLKEVAPLEYETTEEQVRARHILVRIPPESEDMTAEEAEAEALAKIEEARARIEGGEPFEDVAKEMSDDPGSAEQGGDLGWFGRGRMVAEFEDVAFSLEPGQLSEPVKTPFGYHIIEVLEKDPAREVDEAEKERRRDQAFQEWLNAQKEAADIQTFWSIDIVPPLPDDIVEFLRTLGVLGGPPAPPPPAAPTAPPAEEATPASSQ
ncbi:MAG: hypothetical protein GXP42_13045 [Chloroflexi bacterium]|nr:hypothetical protein [Chloroflexota bacterium]